MKPTAGRVVVDVRERPSGVPAALATRGARVEFERLAIGDYCVGRGTSIERKTVRGLHFGVRDGTFWPQLGRLKARAKYPFLLVEGASIDNGPLSTDSIRGLLVTVVDLGVAVLFSSDAADSARWIMLLASRRQRGKAPADRPAYSLRPKHRPDPGEAVLAGIPGVSTATARSLLRQFGSVAGVCAATEEELALAHGVGNHRARSVIAALHSASSRE